MPHDAARPALANCLPSRARQIEATGLAYGAHTGDHAIYPDCRPEFVEAMGSAMRRGTYAGVELLCPFVAATKGGIAAAGAKLGVDFARTYSCYKGGSQHCGTCGTCVERREAFDEAGLKDPTSYVTEPVAPKAGTGQ